MDKKFIHPFPDIFLGNFRGFDLYYARLDVKRKLQMVIARWNNNPVGFLSGWDIAKSEKDIITSALGEAYRRTVERDLELK